MNQDTAQTQNLLNMTNQVGPSGSVTYNQTGNSTFTDSTGKVVSVPQFTQTTAYAPAQQAIYDKTTAAQTNLAQLAQDQSAKMNDYLAKPFTFDNQNAADWSYDLASSRILPQQKQAQSDLQTQLVNSGIRPGTAAYDREMTRLGQTNTDQMNQLALNGRSQAFNEAVQTRNQPINELSALLSSSQVAAPNMGTSATPQASVAGVDYTGLVNSNYQAQAASAGGALGGLFGLAGAVGGAAIKRYSDRRVKRDVERIGTTANGLPWYSYLYWWDLPGSAKRFGVMAQDVLTRIPSAVSADAAGTLMVDYEQALA